MLDFEIVARGLFLPAQLEICYDPALTMPMTPALRVWIEALWQEKLVQARQRNVPLYDAPLFRYVEATTTADHTLKLMLGDTGYKEYVTTRQPEFAAQRARQELGNALSVCSVVETSDEHILLDKREGVDVYEGRFHVIGGFFERGLDTTAEARPDPFAAASREIHEETGVQSADIRQQYCLGVVYDLLTPHAELCFLTQLRIPLATVLARTPLDREIKQLRSLAVTAESLRAFILANHGNISATGEPNLLMYGAWKFGEAWFEDVMEQISGSPPLD
ncbi:MAG TPA: NUDIX hydrolase [Ktedonobacteraceae bacterium]|nr:NUDIX hydrolase [Ktedonobacteraceae bacterium]